ncbi:MAG: hypothetical protein LBG65_04210 [Puniceicoccales bacterium]|jgi:hypothetical protein|nr:hypothetical protein [Puniceicoccales bacterium]
MLTPGIIDLAVKRLTSEAKALRSEGDDAAGRKSAELLQSIASLATEIAAAIPKEEDPSVRGELNSSLLQILNLQSEISSQTPPPEEDGYSLHRLPSGAEVYTRRLPNGQISENYYCPKCRGVGRTATLEFRFGGGGKYICPRCQSIYPSTTPTTSIPPQTPPPPPPPPPPPIAEPQAGHVRDTPSRDVPVAKAPPAWHINRTPHVQIVDLPRHSPAQLRLRRWLANFGQGGFFASIAIHAILFIILITVVITVQPAQKAEETVWTPVGSGGKKGDRETRIQMKKTMREVAQNRPSRIALARATGIAIPDLPEARSSLFSKESGMTGPGGGVFGNGPGYGLPGQNSGFLPSFSIMGLKVSANNLAVYLDSSGSMIPYLPMVKKEILSKFPDADIYEYDGIQISVKDGKVEYGHKTIQGAFMDSNRLLSKKEIIELYGSNFNNGSVGAWVDIMLHQGYDALIIFSDFEDGVLQSDERRGQIFVEKPFEREDKRNKADKEWEEEWKKLCRTVTHPSTRRHRIGGIRVDGGVRFYLFSIKEKPQQIWMDCVKESKGAYKAMPHLRVETE